MIKFRSRSPLTPNLPAIIGLCLCVLLQTACRRQPTKEEMLAGMSEDNRRALESMVNTPLVTEGIDSPEFTSAEMAVLDDGDLVIGIVVGGQARVYPIKRLSSMIDHVVNDRVVNSDGTVKLVTVTYCDMTDCARVLAPTEDWDATSLGVSTLGLLDGGLALEWNGKQFKQMAEVDGLQDIEYQKMTWSQWKAVHPQSLVYKGRTKTSP
jgi:hypothetical protein